MVIGERGRRGDWNEEEGQRPLVCAIQFDPDENPWMGSGQDGHFLEFDRDGKVIGARGRQRHRVSSAC